MGQVSYKLTKFLPQEFAQIPTIKYSYTNKDYSSYSTTYGFVGLMSIFYYLFYTFGKAALQERANEVNTKQLYLLTRVL